jgi:hypothetical protein|tara:strand:- start:4155 stop:4406 length:252 start_codon:yes stop_codon:yes gene_type:complete
MRKIDLNLLYDKRDVKKVLRNLDILWSNAMRINNPRKRSKEILRIHKMIKNAVYEAKSKDSSDPSVRKASRSLANWILTHEDK